MCRFGICHCQSLWHQTGSFYTNCFTPNNDGLNDFLFPLGAGIRSIEYFNIYNRWGKSFTAVKAICPAGTEDTGSRQGTGTLSGK
ncbi:MAG: gliding motility-associated C-terminal domain-containing protein [Chitinophagaceae bacterium]|nr:gliding motility-associated C-terminal domain-containing protein [Chitinophagaceae bacterium]